MQKAGFDWGVFDISFIRLGKILRIVMDITTEYVLSALNRDLLIHFTRLGHKATFW